MARSDAPADSSAPLAGALAQQSIDAAQRREPLLSELRRLEEGIEPQSERAWLFKIAEHVVMYRRRTISRRARVEFPIDVDSLAGAPGH